MPRRSPRARAIPAPPARRMWASAAPETVSGDLACAGCACAPGARRPPQAGAKPTASSVARRGVANPRARRPGELAACVSRSTNGWRRCSGRTASGPSPALPPLCFRRAWRGCVWTRSVSIFVPTSGAGGSARAIPGLARPTNLNLRSPARCLATPYRFGSQLARASYAPATVCGKRLVCGKNGAGAPRPLPGLAMTALS